MNVSEITEMYLTCDLTEMELLCIVSDKNNTLKFKVDEHKDKGREVLNTLRNTTNICKKNYEEVESIELYLKDHFHYKEVWRILESPLTEHHDVINKKRGEFPGSRITIKLRGLESPLYFTHEVNQYDVPYYKVEGFAPLRLLKWLKNMYFYISIIEDRKLKPSDFRGVIPSNSILGNDMVEEIAGDIMEYLEDENGNNWKELTWTEYVEWNAKKDNDIENKTDIRRAFNKAVLYTVSPATAFLLSDNWLGLKHD